MLITVPSAALVSLVTFLGVFFLMNGMLSLVQMFVDRSVPWIWSFLIGISGIAAGVLIIRHPSVAALTLPTMIVIIFGVEGLGMGYSKSSANSQAAGSARSFEVRSIYSSDYYCSVLPDGHWRYHLCLLRFCSWRERRSLYWRFAPVSVMRLNLMRLENCGRTIVSTYLSVNNWLSAVLRLTAAHKRFRERIQCFLSWLGLS